MSVANLHIKKDKLQDVEFMAYTLTFALHPLLTVVEGKEPQDAQIDGH